MTKMKRPERKEPVYRKAVIDPDTGVVLNVIVCGADYAPPQGQLVDAAEGAEIGGTYSQGVFTPPAAPEPVLRPVSPLEALAEKLVEKGVLAESDLPDDTRAALAARKATGTRKT